MNQNTEVVHASHAHTVEQGGDKVTIPSKTYTYGNTKVTVHSKLVTMTEKEKKHWWDEAVENSDHPDHKTVKNICEAANRCVNSSLE